MVMSNSSLLLRGGIVLQHNAEEKIDVLHDTDLLIVGNRIERIGKSLLTPEGCRIINCGNKIICPGFIDTHHHVWQTQLKGRHSDDTLLDYMPTGNMQSFNYTAQDIFWGELGGYLEVMDAGTTCVVDHAHMTYSPNHGLAGLSATITSGIRSVFCYTIIPRLKRWDSEVEPETDPIPAWSITQLKDLAGRQPFGDGRVTIGLGFDMYNLPQDQVINLYQIARNSNVKKITSHWRKNNLVGSGDSIPALLDQYSLLGPDILLSHATGSSASDFALLQSAGACISSTPTTESQMAHGEVVCFRPDVANASLGADCHSAASGSMLHAMRVGLAVARSHRNERVLAAGKFPRRVEPSTLEAFNLATIQAARVIGMEEEVGSLREGKRADLVVFATDTPAMACAVEEDPLVAVVRHAGTREVEMVVVDGVVRKAGGTLMGVDLEREVGAWDGREAVERVSNGGKLDWADVIKQLRRSRVEIQRRIDGCDLEKAKAMALRNSWGASEGDDIFA